jgi:hypothetical protein
MNDNKPGISHEGKVNLGRHQSQCTVCSHPQRQEIEEEWVNWGNTTLLADRSGLSRDSLYRHMRATNADIKRQKNIKGALERMIERLDMASLSGSTIMAALKAYISFCEREEGKQEKGLPPKELLQRMSKQEREAFVQDGSLPEWFSSELDATPKVSPGGEIDAPAEASQEGEKGATPIPSQDSEKVLQVIENNGLQ